MVYWELMTYFRIFIIKTETKTEHQIIRGLEILEIVANVKDEFRVTLIFNAKT